MYKARHNRISIAIHEWQTWNLLSLQTHRRQLRRKRWSRCAWNFVWQNIVSCLECARTRENHEPIEMMHTSDGLMIQAYTFEFRFGDAFHCEKWRKSHQTTDLRVSYCTWWHLSEWKRQLYDLIDGFNLIEDSFGVAMMINGNLAVSTVDASVRRRR